jgi:putative DNA methylase
MVWDFAETNPFAGAGGDIYGTTHSLAEVLDNLQSALPGRVEQQDASVQLLSGCKVVSTDPPYYDNIGYADLSDFFYVWLRRSLGRVFPQLFATMAVPKAEELIAAPYRHGGKEKAEAFFLDGMTQVMRRLAEQTHPCFPVTIYYAFKQSENDSVVGASSTGWETFLDALKKNIGALASSIVLACRRREPTAVTATRREFLSALKVELPAALAHLQRGSIAPVDLAQAAIGPGMSVFTRYSKVLDAEGNPLSVRDALALINQTLDDVMADQEGDFDADSRWALAWFDQQGFAEAEYGIAETLSKAKNTSVSGLVEAGILSSSRGKVRLLKPNELPLDWDPETDKRLTIWETVHHLIRALNSGGEPAAAALVGKLGSQAEVTRELAYRLYTLCERKKRANEALAYNSIVQSWPEIVRLARETAKPAQQEQTEMFASKGGR